jgi:dethiobiotin synthetase
MERHGAGTEKRAGGSRTQVSRGFFITGTDTGVGKTLVTCALSYRYRQQGLSVQAMKPVAAGCEQHADGHWRNQDAEMMLQYGSGLARYADVNPCAYAEPVAPHIAAAQTGEPIDFNRIQAAYRRLEQQHRCVLVEGVGGWRVPLSDDSSVTDLVGQLQLPVLLVVGLRLGCINHALLSYESIIADGHHCLGWVASHIDAEMLRLDENLAALEQRITAPLLGVIPYQPEPDPVEAANFLRAPDLTD